MTENIYKQNWQEKLDGWAYPVMESYVSSDEAKDLVIDFIDIIAKVRNAVKDKRAGIQIDLAKMAFNTALNLMDELGW